MFVGTVLGKLEPWRPKNQSMLGSPIVSRNLHNGRLFMQKKYTRQPKSTEVQYSQKYKNPSAMTTHYRLHVDSHKCEFSSGQNNLFQFQNQKKRQKGSENCIRHNYLYFNDITAYLIRWQGRIWNKYSLNLISNVVGLASNQILVLRLLDTN